MPTNNEDVYEYVHAAQRTGMFKMLKVEFILSVLSVMLILVSLLLTLTILNLINVSGKTHTLQRWDESEPQKSKAYKL